MAAVIGFLMIIAIVALLLKGKMSPIVVLAVVPAIAAAVIATIAHLDGTERPYEVQYPAVLPGKPSDAGIRSHSGDRDDINNLAQ